MEEQSIPGLSVSVARSGQSIWSEAFGVADREAQIPVDRDTLFRIGSVSKPLTSVVLGRLIESGVISLEESPRASLPELPIGYQNMTIRQVAAHVAGIPHYEGIDFVNFRHYESARDALKKFIDRDLLAPPGASFVYSSYGWNLLGAVLEARSGRSFEQLVRGELLVPFGLRRTQLEVPGRKIENRVSNYGVLGGKLIDAPEIDNSDAYPSAGFLATTDDLARFGWLVLSDAVLEDRTRNLLWKEQETTSGEATGYGLGWQWSELAGRRLVGHGGSHVGATAALLIEPASELVVAIAANSNASGFAELEAELVQIFTSIP